MSLKLISGPAVEPLTVSDTVTKLHLRIDTSDEDALLPLYIAAARRQAEQETGRGLITQTWELVLDAFPDAEIDLKLAPVQSITSIKYMDTDGILQTLSPMAYSLDANTLPGWALPAVDTEWPDTLDTANAVTVRFVVGYGADGAAVPEDIKTWMLLQVGHWHGARAATTERALTPLPFADRLLDAHRLYRR